MKNIKKESILNRLNTSVNSNLTQTFHVERFWEIENYGTVPKHDDRIMTKNKT